MVKALMFDFWGTLVENGIRSPIKQVYFILGIEIPFSEYVVRMERAMMTTTFAELKDAFQAVCNEFNVACDDEKMEQLIGLWNKSWMLAQPYPEVAKVLQELKGKFTLILVSNTDCFSVPRVLEKFQLNALFDKIYLSHEQGIIKTDREFFEQVFADNDLTAEDCLMIGDSLESDVAAAQQVRMNAVLIDRRNTRDYTPKVRNLHQLAKMLAEKAEQ